MKNTTVPYCNRAGPLSVVACLAISLFGASAVQAENRRVVLARNSVIPVRLDNSLNSKTAHSGDRFTATVLDGKEAAGLPEGTQVEGVVREAIASTKGKPGTLDLEFRRLVTPGGQNRTIMGSLISLDGKGIRRSESGRMTATASKGRDRLKFIGIGAGAGLLIGSLTKGDNLVATLLGASAGYLYNEFGNKPKPGNVNLKAGTEFGIRLDRALTFQTDQSSTEDASYTRRNNNNLTTGRLNDSRYRVPSVSPDGVVAVGGEHILTIRAASYNKTIEQRADDVAERLVMILAEKSLKPSDIRAVPTAGEQIKIMVKNYLLINVLPEDAHANGTEPMKLAQTWVEHLQKVLPLLNAQPNLNNQKDN